MTLIGLSPERVDLGPHNRGDTFRLYLTLQGDFDGDGSNDGLYDFTGGGDNLHTAVLNARAHPFATTVLGTGSTSGGEIVLTSVGEISVEIDSFLAGVLLARVWYDLVVTDATDASQTIQEGYLTLSGA